MSGLMGTMASGMAFGAGSAVAHQAVGAAVGAFTGGGDSKEAAPAPAAAAQPPAAASACATQQTSHIECLKATNGDANMCQQYFEAFKSCQEQAKMYA